MRTRLYHEDVVDFRLRDILQPAAYERVADASSCDFVVHHHLLWSEENTCQILQDISRKNKRTNKRTIVFVISDDEGDYVPDRNLILFRTSLKASRRRASEFVLPYIWEGTQQAFAPAISTDKPHIGFCGLMSGHRQALISAFQNCGSVQSNFVLRDSFWGGNPHDPTLIADFVENLERNAFAICQRGNGNFSMRFYQALAAGRIPVLVDTDMLLPFSDRLDWDKYIIFGKDEAACIEGVLRVFRSGRYVQMQTECGILYASHFSTELFLQQLIASLPAALRRPPFPGLSGRMADVLGRWHRSRKAGTHRGTTRP